MTLPGLLLRLMLFVDNYGTLVIVMAIIIFLMTLFLQKNQTIKPPGVFALGRYFKKAVIGLLHLTVSLQLAHLRCLSLYIHTSIGIIQGMFYPYLTLYISQLYHYKDHFSPSVTVCCKPHKLHMDHIQHTVGHAWVFKSIKAVHKYNSLS